MVSMESALDQLEVDTFDSLLSEMEIPMKPYEYMALLIMADNKAEEESSNVSVLEYENGEQFKFSTFEELVMSTAMMQMRLDTRLSYIKSFPYQDGDVLVSNYLKTDERLQAVLDKCSLSNLKAEVESGKVKTPLIDEEGKSIIYRKGIIGDWENYFTVAQNEKIERVAEEKFKNSIFNYKAWDC
ncbi:uncharacterized protein LOC123565644 [Mercenaria mercenaria]|uniref:uncharacterized protein LOC123565644 n=1 Tax=Mercenaria mercenaria TaxID=6596 RepID=UPI00234EC601|nr:uncharacterized protein LOC123565644 [Mercenaria mercenaria]